MKYSAEYSRTLDCGRLAALLATLACFILPLVASFIVRWVACWRPHACGVVFSLVVVAGPWAVIDDDDDLLALFGIILAVAVVFRYLLLAPSAPEEQERRHGKHQIPAPPGPAPLWALPRRLHRSLAGIYCRLWNHVIAEEIKQDA
jgi:hypothetical protein